MGHDNALDRPLAGLRFGHPRRFLRGLVALSDLPRRLGFLVGPQIAVGELPGPEPTHRHVTDELGLFGGRFEYLLREPNRICQHADLIPLLHRVIIGDYVSQPPSRMIVYNYTDGQPESRLHDRQNGQRLAPRHDPLLPRALRTRF